MNILLTGYKGFIGQNLHKHLQSLLHNVQGFEYQPGILPNLRDIHQVIHLGAISSTIEKDVDKIISQNFEFSMRLLSLCNSLRINFQYASSASVYGNTTNFRENAAKSPNSPYSWSKYMFDRYVESVPYSQYKIKIQGFRYFNVYGPHEEHKSEQASPITKFSMQAKTQKKIIIFENSENYKRDFVCVHDVCKVHELMLHKQTSGIFNVGTGMATSFKEVAELIAQKHKVPIDIVPMPKMLTHQYQTYTCSNNELLNKHIQIRFQTVKEYIDNEK